MRIFKNNCIPGTRVHARVPGYFFDMARFGVRARTNMRHVVLSRGPPSKNSSHPSPLSSLQLWGTSSTKFMRRLRTLRHTVQVARDFSRTRRQLAIGSITR